MTATSNKGMHLDVLQPADACLALLRTVATGDAILPFMPPPSLPDPDRSRKQAKRAQFTIRVTILISGTRKSP